MQVGDKRYCIIIEGHTDTVGDKNYNYKLSLDRSLSLIKNLKKMTFLEIQI